MLLLTTGESDVERVEADGQGDVEGVRTYEEGDVEGVKVEANEYGGGESGGQVSLGSTIREDNDSGCG